MGLSDTLIKCKGLMPTDSFLFNELVGIKIFLPHSVESTIRETRLNNHELNQRRILAIK